MFRYVPTLLEHSERLADNFSLMPGIQLIGLTGSLARWQDREKANDIDLVLLHDGTLPDGSFSVVRGRVINHSVYCDVVSWVLKEGEDSLRKLFGDRSYPVRRYIKENVPCKVDIICANAAILTDCGTKKIFCDLL